MTYKFNISHPFHFLRYKKRLQIQFKRNKKKKSVAWSYKELCNNQHISQEQMHKVLNIVVIFVIKKA